MEVFSARLKWARERIGYSQKEMAEMLGISQSYYFKFEKGTGEPNLETLAKLPSILNEDVDFFLGLQFSRRTRKLIGEYKSTRFSYKRSKKKYEFISNMVKNGDIDNSKIDLLISQKERTEVAKKRYNESLDELLDHLNEIPYTEPHLLSRDEWEVSDDYFTDSNRVIKISNDDE